MKNLINKRALFILIIISTISLEIIEWYITIKKFIPIQDPGEFDFIGNYRIVIGIIKILFLFTNISFAISLGILLIFKSKIELELRRNIYFSLIYLILLIFLIIVFT